jgi:hypothetical protein
VKSRLFIVVGALLLGGCSGGVGAPAAAPDDIDRARMELLRSALAAYEEPRVSLSWGSPGTPNQLDAVLVERIPGAPISTNDQVRQLLTGALNQLRAAGWQPTWARCTKVAEPLEWAWAASAYRLADGVSTVALVMAQRRVDGSFTVSLILKAPYHTDPADPLPRPLPATLAATGTCLADPGLGEEQGTETDL